MNILKLTEISKQLNEASDALGTEISKIDLQIGRLNLGVSCWIVIYEGGTDDGSIRWRKSLGYTRIKKMGLGTKGRTMGSGYSY